MNETMMKVDFAEPLAPGRTAVLDMAWTFPVPEHGADRMGRDGALYEIAQWFPRAAVYDDVRGWNIEPYLGQGEFYLDYGDYNLAITVPSGYIVAATGALQNAREVLTPTQIARHAAAVPALQPFVHAHARHLRCLPFPHRQHRGQYGLYRRTWRRASQ